MQLWLGQALYAAGRAVTRSVPIGLMKDDLFAPTSASLALHRELRLIDDNLMFSAC